jgi:hypothetical protein
VHAQAKVDDGLGALSKIEVFAQHGDQGYMDYDDGLGKAGLCDDRLLLVA